ncbi:hypothetical protein T492DRAFT_285783 [Pavlovales sp. CCMP2436]|nr:hypothetical protein T492DRAFT_285783 [Pavlovales sp. CCMP2436]
MTHVCSRPASFLFHFILLGPFLKKKTDCVTPASEHLLLDTSEPLCNVWAIFHNVWAIFHNVWAIFHNVWAIFHNVWAIFTAFTSIVNPLNSYINISYSKSYRLRNSLELASCA